MSGRDHSDLGESALVVVVPEAEEAVGRWRAAHDPSADRGVPAHVTVRFPFFPAAEIDDGVLGTLDALASDVDPFTATFRSVERRTDGVWMRPEPEDPFRRLTRAVWTRWPELPPYGGIHADVIPHLTVAGGEAPRGVETAVSAHLPIVTRVAAMELIAFDGDRWTTRERFPLGRDEGR